MCELNNNSTELNSENVEYKRMTYGDIYAKCLETIRHDLVIDYRPNDEMYVDDLKDNVGIRLWFKNGDSAIYFPSGMGGKEKMNRDEAIRILAGEVLGTREQTHEAAMMIRLINANKAIAELELDVEMDKAALDNLDIVGKTRDEIEFDMKWKQKAIELLQTEPTVLQAYDNGLIPCIRE